MAIWQWGLLGLGVVWALQALGVWLQMRHYTDVFKGITSKYQDGYVGAGNCKGRFGRGTIALLVVTPDLVVQRLLTMTGRSVFAKFRRNEKYEGMTLDQLRSDPAAVGEGDAGVAKAVEKAIEQVDRARQEPKQPGLSGVKR